MATAEVFEPSDHQHATGWSAAATIAVWAAGVLVLLLPAVYNGFPLIFPDTGAYLSVSYADKWTLDRAGFYGLLFKPILMPTKPVAGLWLVLALQVALISAILQVTVRLVAPSASPVLASILIAITALLTALPWHSAQLMPDAFTGPLVLLVWLAASRDPSAPGSPSIWLAVVVLGLMHYTHLGLIAAVVAASCLVLAAFGASLAEIAKRVVAALIALSAIITAHVAAHGIMFDRWSVSPMGSMFLFARLHEDGLTSQWFDRHCGRDAPKPLCEIRHELPRDSQMLLWGGSKSPLVGHINDKVGQPEMWRWIDMLQDAAMGSLREQPVAFAGLAASATGRQLLRFEALDDECPANCGAPDLIALQPALAPEIAASRQRRGAMPKAYIRGLTNLVAWASLLLALPLMALAWSRKDAAALSLLVAIAAALLANAFMAGALSDVHDRYQSRLVWLVPFAIVALAARWRAFRRPASIAAVR